MSKVFVNIGLSLDGYMAPEGMTMENWEYKNWGAKWGALMAWILNQQYFRENLKLGPGGETGPVNDLVRGTTERIGVNIMGGMQAYTQFQTAEAIPLAARVVEWIAAQLNEAEAARTATAERVTFHKLTRAEYANTIRDLLGVTYDASDPAGLPEDPDWQGFERLGAVLTL